MLSMYVDTQHKAHPVDSYAPLCVTYYRHLLSAHYKFTVNFCFLLQFCSWHMKKKKKKHYTYDGKTVSNHSKFPSITLFILPILTYQGDRKSFLLPSVIELVFKAKKTSVLETCK